MGKPSVSSSVSVLVFLLKARRGNADVGLGANGHDRDVLRLQAT